MDKISQIMKLAQACGYGPHYGKFVADHPEVLERDAQIPVDDPNAKVYTCAFCGKKCVRTDKRLRRYCSDDCRQKMDDRKARERNPFTGYDKVCPVCGVAFHTRTARKIYCNDLCKQISRTKIAKEVGGNELEIGIHGGTAGV